MNFQIIENINQSKIEKIEKLGKGVLSVFLLSLLMFQFAPFDYVNVEKVIGESALIFIVYTCLLGSISVYFKITINSNNPNI